MENDFSYQQELIKKMKEYGQTKKKKNKQTNKFLNLNFF